MPNGDPRDGFFFLSHTNTHDKFKKKNDIEAELHHS